MCCVVAALVAIVVCFGCIWYLVCGLLIFSLLGYMYWHQLQPTHTRLSEDLKRLEYILPLEEFKKSRYQLKHVQHYYSNTTFTDYKFLEIITGCNAMHTDLVPRHMLPYKANFMQQLFYVIQHIGELSKGGRVLEVGIGKGPNSIFLASMFPQARFIGLDVLQEHVSYATTYASKANLKNVEFHKQDASNITGAVLNMHFDIIFAIESFCHLDSEEKLRSFVQFASAALAPGGKIIVVDGFRSGTFDNLPSNVQQAMNLAESGFRIKCMPSKAMWVALADANGFNVLENIDLTDQAARFWTKWWKIAQLLLLPPFGHFIMKHYFRLTLQTAETGSNMLAMIMTAYAMNLGSGEYGVLVFKKN